MSELSPIPDTNPEPVEFMDFYRALKAIEYGRTISKEEWAGEASAFLKNDLLYLERDGTDHTWTISLADMEGKDYFIIK